MSQQLRAKLNWKQILMIGAPIAIAGAVTGLVYWYNTGRTDRSQRQGSSNNLPTVLQDDAGDATTLKHVPNSAVSLDGETGESGAAGSASNSAGSSVLDRAIRAKNLGNKYFRGQMYAKAIEHYTEAIQLCTTNTEQQQDGGASSSQHGGATPVKIQDEKEVATFYQNRAAAHEKASDLEQALSDIEAALALHPRYVKALTRKARLLEMKGGLTEALETAMAVCFFDSFNSEENLRLVDRVMRKLATHRYNHMMNSSPPPLPSSISGVSSSISSAVRRPLKHQVLPGRAQLYNYFKSFESDPFLSRIDEYEAELAKLEQLDEKDEKNEKPDEKDNEEQGGEDNNESGETESPLNTTQTTTASSSSNSNKLNNSSGSDSISNHQLHHHGDDEQQQRASPGRHTFLRALAALSACEYTRCQMLAEEALAQLELEHPHLALHLPHRLSTVTPKLLDPLTGEEITDPEAIKAAKCAPANLESSPESLPPTASDEGDVEVEATRNTASRRANEDAAAAASCDQWLFGGDDTDDDENSPHAFEPADLPMFEALLLAGTFRSLSGDSDGAAVLLDRVLRVAKATPINTTEEPVMWYPPPSNSSSNDDAENDATAPAEVAEKRRQFSELAANAAIKRAYLLVNAAALGPPSDPTQLAALRDSPPLSKRVAIVMREALRHTPNSADLFYHRAQLRMQMITAAATASAANQMPGGGGAGGGQSDAFQLDGAINMDVEANEDKDNENESDNIASQGDATDNADGANRVRKDFERAVELSGGRNALFQCGAVFSRIRKTMLTVMQEQHQLMMMGGGGGDAAAMLMQHRQRSVESEIERGLDQLKTLAKEHGGSSTTNTTKTASNNNNDDNKSNQSVEYPEIRLLCAQLLVELGRGHEADTQYEAVIGWCERQNRTTNQKQQQRQQMGEGESEEGGEWWLGNAFVHRAMALLSSVSAAGAGVDDVMGGGGAGVSRSKVAEAERALKEGIRRDPTCHMAYETLATLLIQQAKLDEAAAVLQRGVTSSAKSAAELRHMLSTREAVAAQISFAAKFGVAQSDIVDKAMNSFPGGSGAAAMAR